MDTDFVFAEDILPSLSTTQSQACVYNVCMCLCVRRVIPHFGIRTLVKMPHAAHARDLSDYFGCPDCGDVRWGIAGSGRLHQEAEAVGRVLALLFVRATRFLM